MPSYEYIEGDRRIIRILPVADRDKFPGRVTVPSRINVCPRGPSTQGDEVLRGFYRAEQTYGNSRVRLAEKALGLDHHKVKSVWKHPRNQTT